MDGVRREDMGQGVVVSWFDSLSVDWGSVPDWVGGIGTAGGLIFVYVGLRREIHRQRGEEYNNKAAQARLVPPKARTRGTAAGIGRPPETTAF